MNFKEAAYHVLKKEKKPLSAKDITEISIKEGLITTKGKTPIATVGAIIYTDIKAKRDSSIFVKMKRGLFGLREWKIENIKKEEKMHIQDVDMNISIMDKLRKTQYESRTPEEFENALKEAFSYFGFKAELIGKSGDTDVLLTADIGDETYKVTVDGKTAKKGKILESQINWDSLEDHRKKHNADYTVVIGHDFSEGKLLERAEAHKVSVLPTEYVIKLIEEHSKYPITLLDFKDVFARTGNLSERVDDLLEQNRIKCELLSKFKIILEEMKNLQDAHGFFNLDRLCGRLLEHEMDEDTLKSMI